MILIQASFHDPVTCCLHLSAFGQSCLYLGASPARAEVLAVSTGHRNDPASKQHKPRRSSKHGGMKHVVHRVPNPSPGRDRLGRISLMEPWTFRDLPSEDTFVLSECRGSLQSLDPVALMHKLLGLRWFKTPVRSC